MIAPSDVSRRINDFNKCLLPEKVLIKYKRMAESAYRFYRGSCHLFYEDLSKIASFPISPTVWICGDLHLENFGSYKADNRFVYFDQNDFDESLIAPAAWELVRMVTSICVAFDIKEEKVLQWARLYLKIYCDTLIGGKAKPIEARLANGIVKSFLLRISKRSSKELLRKQIIKKNKKHYIFIDNEKHFSLETTLKAELMDFFKTSISLKNKVYQDYKVEDVAFRVAGTGSVGARRYIYLLHNQKNKRNFLLLDMKESRPSSVEKYVSIAQPLWGSNAARVATIQSRMQYATVALTDVVAFKGVYFVIQEVQPAEDKIDITLIKDRDKQVRCVLEDMAVLTASGQLRSSGRQGSAITDELIEFAINDGWQQQLLDYAVNYSKQVHDNYQQFLQDYKTGYFKCF